MITNTKILEKYCTDYKNIENYEEAVKSPLKYDLHHRLEIDEMQTRSDLIFLHLYYHRPPEELIFLEHGEHVRLHNKGKFVSTDTRQKLSDANKGKQNALGHHFNPSTETKQRMSESHKGKHRPAFSTEWKQRMSEAKKGDKNPMFGKNMSAETRQKISNASKGRMKGKHWHVENGKHVYTD